MCNNKNEGYKLLLIKKWRWRECEIVIFENLNSFIKSLNNEIQQIISVKKDASETITCLTKYILGHFEVAYNYYESSK